MLRSTLDKAGIKSYAARLRSREIAIIATLVLVGLLYEAIPLSSPRNSQIKFASSSNVTLTFSRIGKFGYLGNQLFQVSSTIGIAMARGVNWDFPAFINETEIGSLCDISGALTAEDLAHSTTIPEKLGTFHDVQIPNDTAGIYSLEGYFQSPLYFQEYEPFIHNFVKFKPDLVARVQSEVPESLSPNAVALHVRRGDYVETFSDIYTILDENYYLSALQQIPNIDVVVIASNDIAWCREKFGNLPFKVIFSPFTEPALDLVLLSQCRHKIIANSSFSWWAAYLGQRGGVVVAPSPWYNVGGKLGSWNSDDMYLDGWIVQRVA